MIKKLTKIFAIAVALGIMCVVILLHFMPFRYFYIVLAAKSMCMYASLFALAWHLGQRIFGKIAYFIFGVLVWHMVYFGFVFYSWSNAMNF
jgi:hypothetical protein